MKCIKILLYILLFEIIPTRASGPSTRPLPNIPWTPSQLQKKMISPVIPPNTSSLWVIRLCNGTIALRSDPLMNVVPQTIPNTEDLCFGAKLPPPLYIYPAHELTEVLGTKTLALDTRIKAAVKEVQEYPEAVSDLVAHSLDSKDGLDNSFDFNKALNKLSMNSESINLYATLCRAIYFDPADPKNPGRLSTEYSIYLKKLNDRFKDIKSRLSATEKTIASLDHSNPQRKVLDQQKIKLVQDAASAELGLEYFLDPNLQELWRKMETIPNIDVKKYAPIILLYRNKTPYADSSLAILNSVKSFFKKTQDTKDISGAIFIKMADQEITGNPLIDEVIISFAGSKNLADWEHNLDAFKNNGLGRFDLLPQLQIHRGILAALNESLQDAGTKINLLIRNYIQQRQRSPVKPILRITVDGHSLGGAMANILGVFIKENISKILQNIATLEVRVVTFGAPPIYSQKSAKRVDEILGKTNSLRFWTLRDPVANLEINNDRINKGARSPLSALLGFFHTGTSIPLFEHDKIKKHSNLLSKLDDVMGYHYMLAYLSALSQNWQLIGFQKLSAIRDLMKARNIFDIQILLQRLTEVQNFIEDSPDWSINVTGLTIQDIKDLIKKKNATPQTVSATVENYQILQEQNYEKGKTDPLKFKKVDLSQESKKVTYLQRSKYKDIYITVGRSTSCEVDSLSKQFKFDVNSVNQSIVSCTCCIVKNTFVSYGEGTALHQLKDAIKRKNIKTPVNILTYCDKQKRCSDPTTKQTLFPASQDLMVSFANLMNSVGLKELWLSKKVE